MIHYSRLHILTEQRGPDRRPLPFDLKFIKKSTGEIVTCKQWVCTSSYFENRTRNIMNPINHQVRKIKNVLIIEFNGQKVFA